MDLIDMWHQTSPSRHETLAGNRQLPEPREWVSATVRVLWKRSFLTSDRSEAQKSVTVLARSPVSPSSYKAMAYLQQLPLGSRLIYETFQDFKLCDSLRK